MANDDDSSHGDSVEDASSNMPAVREEAAEDVSQNGSVAEETSSLIRPSLNVDTTPDDLFVDEIFKIIILQKNKIDIFLGNLITSIQRKEILFKPV